MLIVIRFGGQRSPQDMATGQGYAKMDLKKAYRMVPVHPDDHALLGLSLERDTFIVTALPFGLRSVPKIFSAVADALAWVLHDRGVGDQMHYPDDFLFLGPPGDTTCAQALCQALDTCQELGVPVAAEKVEGPATCLTFLESKSTRML